MPDGNKKPQIERLGLESAIGASLLSERAEAQSFDVEKMKRTLQNDPFYFEGHEEEINFETDDKITPEIQNFVKQLISLQNRIFDVAITNKPSINSLDKKGSFNINMTALESLCKEIFTLITRQMQINLSFSRDNYNYLFLYELPKYLSKFGIVIYDTIFRIDDGTANGLGSAYPFALFFGVEGKRIESADGWNRTIETPVLNVRPVPEFGEQKSSQFVGVNNQFANGNVMLLNRSDEITASQREKNKALFENLLKSDESSYLDLVRQSNDPITQATLLASAQILKRNGGVDFIFSDATDRIKLHEIGHMIFNRDSKDLSKHKAPTTKGEFLINPLNLNVQIHREIGAILYEMKKVKNKDKVFLLFLKFIRSGVLKGRVFQDFEHDEAVNWVFDRMVNLIKRDPFKYGMEIDFESPVSHENQIIMQLAKISANPKWVEELVDEIHEIHLQNLQQGFLAKYYRSQDLPMPAGVVDKPIVETVYEVKKPFPVVEIGVGALAVGGMVAGGIALNKWGVRKELVRLEERLPDLIRKRVHKKYNVNELVNNLQFGASKENLDLQRRQGAIAELRRIKVDEKIIAYLEKHL